MAHNSRFGRGQGEDRNRHYDRRKGVTAAIAYLEKKPRYNSTEHMVFRRLDPLLKCRDIAPGLL